ncbi:hypothetical protein FA13DRAFT_1733463 [Coprinellus micaceus]|uniref:Protein kinase domain-containing protein n=1 Tax=Coprinellus micaceus TaxID=71717 RepID=A0A4Y7T9J6_COPMI|nr:hypothetical protein FA13DRAFT_1733463 [Coprinellus micaceus]
MYPPEEALNLTTQEGGGYFGVRIRDTLNKGGFEVVRRLGWGTRSSVWLAPVKGQVISNPLEALIP